MKNHTILKALASLVLILSCAALIVQPGRVSAEISTLPDCYVNAATGDDANTGASPDQAKKTIQACVDAVDSVGTVDVSAGTYVEVVQISKSLTLLGEAGAIIKPDNTTPLSDQGMRRAAIYINGVDGVTIDGFEIDGTDGDVHYGVYGFNSNRSTVKNMTIHDIQNAIEPPVSDVAGVGILFFGWGQEEDDITIENNTIETTGRMGIWIGGMQSETPYKFLVSSGNVIRGNTVEAAWQGPTNDGGGSIQINGAKDCTIEANHVSNTGNDEYGIYIYGSVSPASAITGNEISDNPKGVGIWSDGDWVHFGSETIQPPTLTGNQFASNGIQVNDYGSEVNRIDIAQVLTNNTFDRAVTVDHPGSSLLPTIWSHIQDGVNAAASGDTVNVAAGYYSEQVTISKPLTLEGAGKDSTYIEAPLAAERTRVNRIFMIDGSPTEIVFDYVLGALDTDEVTIRNLTVDGLSHGVIDCIPKLHASGVLFLDSSGTFENAKVVNAREDPGPSSCKDEVWFGYQAAAASANGKRSVTVQDVELSNFQYIGLYTWTDAQGNLTAAIRNNHIAGRIPFTRATQRGIQISGGATGVIDGNTLENFSSTGVDPWPSTAILAVGATGLQISNNIINNSQLGIYQYFTTGEITGNKISTSQSGSGLNNYRAIAIFKPPLAKADTQAVSSSEAQKLPSMSIPQALIVEPVEPFVISILNNELMGGGDSKATIGVDIDQGYSVRDIELTVKNNKIHGWGTALYFGQCTAGPGETCRTGKFATLDIAQNSFSRDVIGIDNTIETTASATGNWWGDATGPTTLANPHGKGAAIEGPATFDPWLCDGTDANPTVGFQPSDEAQCTVEDNNHPPVLASIGDIVVNDGETTTIDITATDEDGDTLTFTAENRPSFASLTDHGNGTASLILNPGDNDVGEYPNVTITVSDNYKFKPASDQETFKITVIDNDADLSVALTDGLTEVFPGTPITYTLEVHNAGTAEVKAARLNATIHAKVKSVTWTCSASTGSSCTASGSGNSIVDSVDLAVNGSLTYTITGVVDAAFIGDLVSTAQISVPEGFNDTDSTNNQATDTTKVVYRKVYLPLISR